MVLLRRVIGDALRSRRQGQQRTLREVSSAANVSLGYLSEVERGQKEPSSELLAAICDALGARLSEVLREVSDNVAVAEQLPSVLVPIQDRPVGQDGAAVQDRPASQNPSSAQDRPVGQGPAAQERSVRRERSTGAMEPAGSPAGKGKAAAARVEPAAAADRADVALRTLAADPAVRQLTADGEVSVSVRQDSPLKTTLRTTRRMHNKNERDVVRAA